MDALRVGEFVESHSRGTLKAGWSQHVVLSVALAAELALLELGKAAVLELNFLDQLALGLSLKSRLDCFILSHLFVFAVSLLWPL